MMKKNYWIIVIILLSVSIITYIISTTINLLLNKKYVVDEISYTDRKKGLEGIQEVISADYVSIFYLNIIIVIFVLIYTIIIIWKLRKK